MKYGRDNGIRRQEPGKRTAPRSAPPAARTEIPGFVQERSPERERRREQMIHQTTVKRKKRRRKNYILYYILLGIISITTGIILSRTVLFKLETITVEGNGTIGAESIIAASGVKQGDNLWSINIDRAEKSIIGQFIDIDSVTLHRDLPSGLRIQVEQSEPVAVLRWQNIYYPLSGGGRLIGRSERNNWMGVPEVIGCSLTGMQAGDYLTADPSLAAAGVVPADEKNKYDTLLGVLDAIEGCGLTDVGYIDLTDITALRLYYQDRVELKFGSLIGLDYEMSCVKTILETEISEVGYFVIDDMLANGKYYIRQPDTLELPLRDEDTPPSGGDAALQPAGGDASSQAPDSSAAGSSDTDSGSSEAAVSSGDAGSDMG